MNFSKNCLDSDLDAEIEKIKKIPGAKITNVKYSGNGKKIEYNIAIRDEAEKHAGIAPQKYDIEDYNPPNRCLIRIRY